MALVQDDFLALSWEVLLSQPVAMECWATWCSSASSGLPVICGSVLKVRIFQDFFLFQGLHSSSLPRFLHCLGHRGWAVLGLGAAGRYTAPAWLGWDAEPCIGYALGCCSFHCCSEPACSPRWALPPCPCPPRGCNKALVPSLLCLFAQYVRKKCRMCWKAQKSGFF